MAGIENFRAAAAQIRQGIMAKRNESNELRNAIDQKKRDLDASINRINDRIRAIQADMAKTQDNQSEPDKDRAQKLRAVMDLQQEIVDRQHDFAREREQMIAQVQQQERTLDGLEQQANSLASFS